MSKTTTNNLRGLDKWYHRQKRVLPWRDEPTPYRVWISEIMLQQTQVLTVLPYFERFLRRFPNVGSLARAREQSVLKQWEGLGYYSRARNLHRAAKEIVKNGFPETLEAWLDLPGVGPYTAGAICSIAFNSPQPILDGNVERVLSRVCLEPEKKRLWKLAKDWVIGAEKLKIPPRDFNQAMMELGALVCTPKGPSCRSCPLSQACGAFQETRIEEFPPRRQRAPVKKLSERRQCLLNAKNQVYLVQQSQGAWREGLWDFPLEARGRKIGEVDTRHVVTRHRIERKTEVRRVTRELNLKGIGKWVDIDSPSVPVGAAVQKVLRSSEIRLLLRLSSEPKQP